MTIELITGNPGAGKTTYAVAERVAKEAERELALELNGQPKTVRRRVLVAGIPGLLVEHEKLPHTLTGDHQSQKVIDYYNEIDADGEHVHKRGRNDPPVDLPATLTIGGKELASGPSLFNWWLWCKPGDLIVVDEVQFIVPRGTLGRKPPPYIALLEIHRHYGVDFLFITQHPQLLDTTIRNLVGMHRHVRSVMASRMCMVYAWDHASNPERFTLATKSQFLRRAEHYRLFKSAVAHVKAPATGRGVLVAVPVLLLAMAFFGYRVWARHAPPQKASHAADAASAAGAAGLLGRQRPASPAAGSGKPGAPVLDGGAPTTARADWPLYTSQPVHAGREPLDGRALQWEGGYTEGATTVALFGLYLDGERVATLTLAQLAAMGYAWTTWGPCVGSLRFGKQERLVTCGKRNYAPPKVNDGAPGGAGAPPTGGDGASPGAPGGRRSGIDGGDSVGSGLLTASAGKP